MRIFTSYKGLLWKAAIAAFWLILWQGMAVFFAARYRTDILFPGPLQTLESLRQLAGTGAFWLSIVHSLCKIAAGFVLAFAAGAGLAVLGRLCPPVSTLFAPAVQIMKSVPVASFIVVALIWMHADNISILVSFFVVFPVVYFNLSEGLRQMDPALLEMARVFRMPLPKRLRALYIPQVMPYLISGCRVAVGMAWKAGVAGEIIGLPGLSIGEQLYLSKLYLATADLFAWTIVIICISLLCERAVVRLLDRLRKRWEAAYGNPV